MNTDALPIILWICHLCLGVSTSTWQICNHSVILKIGSSVPKMFNMRFYYPGSFTFHCIQDIINRKKTEMFHCTTHLVTLTIWDCEFFIVPRCSCKHLLFLLLLVHSRTISIQCIMFGYRKAVLISFSMLSMYFVWFFFLHKML